jgi:hypothetical protein
VLDVTWRIDGEQVDRTAEWPVNVVDPAELPPPEVLRDLTLDELVEALSSTRPIHESIPRLLRKRGRVKTTVDVELDPLKRVNTEEFLLRRLRRVAVALDRLRERLERPVLSAEALAWRLRGPIGPVSLAQALLKDARLPGEAAFFLAELVLMLGRVRPQLAARGGLASKVIADEVAAVIGEIKLAATGHLPGDTPASMRTYVEEALETVTV